MTSDSRAMTKARALKILDGIATDAAESNPAAAAIARRMAQVYKGVPGARMPTDAEIAALNHDDDDDEWDD